MSWPIFAFAAWGALTALTGLIMALARTSPDEARSNLSKWAEMVGVHSVPPWLRRLSGDRFVFRWAARAMALLIGLAVGFGVATYSNFRLQALSSWHPSNGSNPRYLTSDEQTRFTDTLKFAASIFPKGKIVTVATISEAQCGDCEDFRQLLARLINNAPGWASPDQHISTLGSTERNVYGLELGVTEGGDATGAEAIALALHAAGLQFSKTNGYPMSALGRMGSIPAIALIILPPSRQ